MQVKGKRILEDDLAMVEVNLDVIGEFYYLQHATVQIMIFIELYDEMSYYVF